MRDSGGWVNGRRIRDVLVGADTGGFEGFRAQLFVLVGDHVDAEGELVDIGALAAEVEDADFGVGDTAVEAGFGVGLVFCVSIQSGNRFLEMEVRFLERRREKE